MKYSEAGRIIDTMLRIDGGCTIAIVPLSEGKVALEVAKPTHGYQVGIKALHEGVYYDIETMNLSQLIDQCHGGYIGFWLSRDKIYIDASMHIMDKASAIRSARERNEIAIWDWGTSEEIAIDYSKQE